MRTARFILLLAVVAAGAPTGHPAEQPPEVPAQTAPALAALAGDNALSLIAAELKVRFNLNGELQLDFANPWYSPPRTAREWRIAIVDYPSVASSSMVVRFKPYADGEALPETTAVLRASLWRDAWFAREPLEPGNSLDSSLIEAKRVDVFRIRDSVTADTSNPDLIVTHSVQAGSVLTWKDVGHRPLVRKGEIVDVSASTGLLKVTMKAVALQSGAMGDIVNVRNPESLKMIPAVVVGEDRVEVRL